MAMPRISVAMATFNGMPYLEAQLRSFETQTASIDELVVCDDGSTDGTWEYLKQFASSRPYVRCSRNECRLGATKNFERAIALCTGAVIFLSDQDDVWRADKVELLARELDRRAAVLAMSNGALVAADGQSLGRDLWSDNGITPAIQEALQSARAWEALVSGKYFTGSALCFRADVRPAILPIPEGAWHDQWIAFILALSCPGRLALLDRALYDYRQHAGNQIGARRGTFLKRAFREVSSFADVTADVRYRRAVLERLERLAQGGEVEQNSTARMKQVIEDSLWHAQRRCDFVDGQLPWGDFLRPERLREYREFSRGGTTAARDLLARLLRWTGRQRSVA